MFQWGGKVAGEFGRRVGQVPRFIDQRLISFESIRTIIANRKLYNKSQVNALSHGNVSTERSSIISFK